MNLQASVETFEVPSSVRKSTVYLEIRATEFPGHWKIDIRPTDLGHKQLNRFWTAWLEDLLLNGDELKPGSLMIEADSHRSVSFQATCSLSQALEYVWRQTYKIKPLQVPFKVAPWQECRFARTWEWPSPTVKEAATLRAIRLPLGATLTVKHWLAGYDARIILVRPKKHCPLSLSALSRIVEYRMAMIHAQA